MFFFVGVGRVVLNAPHRTHGNSKMHLSQARTASGAAAEGQTALRAVYLGLASKKRTNLG